jgi:hypothetical protein
MPTLEDHEVRIRALEEALARAITLPDYHNSLQEADLRTHHEARNRGLVPEVVVKDGGKIDLKVTKTDQTILET